MYEFRYLKPASLQEASSKLGADEDARVLAGGQTLIASMKLRLSKPAELLDLSTIAELKGIKVDKDTVTIGAMTRHVDVLRSAEIKKAIPALSELAGYIGDRMVRNRGTMGGSVANNDPAADYPAAVVGMDATISTTKRKIAADDFFTGIYETALEPGEILTAISYPIPKRAAYMKFRNPASRFALVGVFVAQTAKGARVAVTGAGPCVFRVPEMEKALDAQFTPDAVAGIKISDDGLNSDIHAQADYRAHLVTVMAKRAVEQALKY